MNTSTSPFFLSIRILHFSLMLGVALVSFVLYNFVGSSAADSNPTFFFAVAAFWLLAIIASNFLGRKRMDEAKTIYDVEGRKLAYKNAFLLRLALLEGATLVCLVVHFFMHGEKALLVMAALSWLSMLPLAPNKEKIMTGLSLKPEDLE